ncbi:MAG: 1-acyl-sn-glycerol-3-phosphate acyltransferase [Verrucomicrobiae bacterium]|nr:1-acyl-sn-glycerol-3-phosphate acyltransferase [Verrucomicrobiae bacterium]
MTLPYRLCQLAFRALAPLIYRERRIRGLENLPLTGPAIFVSNHISYWDPATLVTFVPRQVYFMSRNNMFGVPVLGTVFRALDVFGVERGTADIGAIRQALAILERGDPVALYPQGSRTPLPSGQVHQAKGGALLIAQRSRAPIVPVAISGLETLFLARFPWLGRPAIDVTFGRPFFLDELGESADDRNALLRSMMRRVTDLLPNHES